jgi:hypothetical protein
MQLKLRNSRARNAIAARRNLTGKSNYTQGNWPWPNFSRGEMACPHCGEDYYWPEFMHRLQAARSDHGRPFHINSAHRCSLYNARIGGAPLSQHLRLAADISLRAHEPDALYRACLAAGFRGFGFYQTFLHVDLGRSRRWFGGRYARSLWTPLLD